MSLAIHKTKVCKNPECGKTIPYKRDRRGMCPSCYQKVMRREHKPQDRATIYRGTVKGYSPAWDYRLELDLLRIIGMRDFWSFFLYFFGDGLSPKGQKWIDPEIHEPLARWYQKHVDEWMENRANGIVEQKDIAVLVHREMGKSRMITAAGQLWLHLRDPEVSSYTGSESLELSAKLLNIMRAVLDGTDPYGLFHRIYGNWSTDARQWTAKAITHAARKETTRADPSLGTFAVETSIVGAHPDAIFYDDPISYDRMLTDANWLQAVNAQVTSQIPVLQSDGLRVWVGTRYADEDHFGIAFRSPEEGGDGVASISGMDTGVLQVHPGGKWHVYFLAGRDTEGKPTSPKVWPESRLVSFQRRNALHYASQIMNDPELSEFNPITKDQIKQCLIPAKEVPWSALRFGISTDIAFWDGKSREKKDESVIMVHGYTRNGSGDVYVVEAHGSATWRMEDFGHRLVAIVQRYRRQGRRITGISGEVAMSGLKGSFAANLRNFFADANEPMPTYFEFGRGGTRKVERMVAAASFWVDGHVRVVEGSPGSERLMEQMSKIGQYMVRPRLRNDWVDAHSDAFQPEFYQPMRRQGPQRPPYEQGSIPIRVDGLDHDSFDDSDAANWLAECPREPLR
jgi:hypothetical protein